MLAALVLALAQCDRGDEAPHLGVRLIPEVVLRFPDGAEIEGPVRLFADREVYVALDVRNLSRLHLFGRDGTFHTTWGPMDSSAGRPILVSSVLFDPDGTTRILSGRSQRAFVTSRSLDGLDEMVFRRQGVWDAVPTGDGDLIVNVPSTEPGAVGLPLHRVSMTGDLVNSFGRETGVVAPADLALLRWPMADEVLDGTLWAVDPMDLSVRRFALSGEPVGEALSAPTALRRALDLADPQADPASVTPMKSWPEAPDRIWSLTWVPRAHLGELGLEPVPCPLPENHAFVDLGSPSPIVSVIDVRQEAAPTHPHLTAVDCRLMGILAHGRVYLTSAHEESGDVEVRVFRLEPDRPNLVTDTQAVRDSAGLQIVEHRTPLHEDLWTVDPDPVLEIGSVESEDALLFHRIRGAVLPRTATGEALGIVVADGGSRELRVFSPAGDLTAVMGGDGEAPGEFRSLDGILLVPRDTILAFDAGAERISRFHLEGGTGEVVETVRLERLPADALGDGRALGGAARLVGRAGDGSLFVEPTEFVQEAVEGLWREEWLVVRLDGDGRHPVILGRFFRSERFVARDGPRASVIGRPFGRRGDVKVAGSELLVSDGSFPGYARFSLDGERLGIVRTSHGRPPVTAQDRERWRSERITDPGDGDPADPRRRLTVQAITQASFPEVHPAVEGMLLDPCGFVWLRRVLPPAVEDADQQWLVFRLSDQQWMGSVRLPRGQEPVHIGEEHVVSISTTDLGEEFVQLRRIGREPPSCSGG